MREFESPTLTFILLKVKKSERPKEKKVKRTRVEFAVEFTLNCRKGSGRKVAP